MSRSIIPEHLKRLARAVQMPCARLATLFGILTFDPESRDIERL